MSQQPEAATKPRKKFKNFAQIAGSCKMAKLSDGYVPRSCPDCGTSNKLKTCPWCGYVRGKKK